jgi:hypothetical protein
MQITDKQRRFAWIGGALVAIYFAAPWIINTVRNASTPTQAAVAKPSAAHIAPLPPAPPPPPISPEDALNAQAAKMMGDWSGGGLIPARGLCKVGLQIKPDPLKPGSYSGYSTTSCNPAFAMVGRSRQEMTQKVLTGITPVSLIMSGSAVKGEIHFQIDKAVGLSADCPITGFSATPFGEQVMAQWQAGETCQGGQMILNRVTNLR